MTNKFENDKAIITARKLGKVYGDYEAVKGVNFVVYQGECLGLLGPNGAGKSTIVKMIYGFSPVTTGELLVFDMNISDKFRSIKSQIGVVPQDDNLDPDLSVWENLIIYASYFKMSWEIAAKRAEEILSFMELHEKRKEVVQNLSGGMRRRLTLGRALINKPRLFILDEPTTGLDPYARHILWQRLRRLRDEGTTMVLTTHYLEEASQLCDRLVIIYKGEIIEEGTPRGLIEKHIGKEVMELGIEKQYRERIIHEVSELIKDYQTLGDNLLLFSNVGGELSDSVSKVEREEGLSIRYKRLRPSTLEDVFFKLTGETLNES